MKDKTITTKMEELSIKGEHFYKITNVDELRPFFMSIVSDSNHWMFISSNGGLSAGRKNADHALFPYYTDDKITNLAETTGSKSIFIINKNENAPALWEPFSIRQEGVYNVSQNLYKNRYGNKVMFEEVNHDLELTFRYQWNSSSQFGFVRKSKLVNDSDQEVRISLVDGIQNIIPAGVGSDLQNQTSNLVDAYKRSELIKASGIGIFALSAIIVDKAEPSEALKANIVWSLGLNNPTYLLSSLQLKDFRKRKSLLQEEDIKAEKGAYFVHENIVLQAKSEKEWMIIANVNQKHSAVVKLGVTIQKEKRLEQIVKKDIDKGTQRLIQLNAAADGLQRTADDLRDTRHFANTLFNIMRGGIFDHNYQIERWNLCDYLSKANTTVFENATSSIDKLPDVFSLTTLTTLAHQSEDADFRRLCLEYLPLKFSRRHGDPSRPWNKFSINTNSEQDGSKILDYQGNWRDIFQNWEALVQAYPMFIEGMIRKFLNAMTFDGYNPYRVTKDGFDWESIEPDNPWSYIGYWSDHQVIYLLKLLEFMEDYAPGKLESYFNEELFVYANVPYKIKSYKDILKNSKDTIVFDDELDRKLRSEKETVGADATLLYDENKSIYTVTFLEKILAIVLAKLANFIPEGGIWMNTQRPEWNDANNALVGNGVSMVTLYYLRRFMQFFNSLLAASNLERVNISNELIVYYKAIQQTLENHLPLLSNKINDLDRKLILDDLGTAASNYREHIYKQTFWGNKRTLSLKSLKRFIDLSIQYIDHSIKANKRPDNLYHAYNLMTLENSKEISISYLSEMLEGQVAVLSSGYLSSKEALEVLGALKNSSLFREDQYSYLLYPNKDLPRFSQKNNLPEEIVAQSPLLSQLIEDGNLDIIEKDVNGAYHFNGNFKNADDLKRALKNLASSMYAPRLIEENIKQILQAFEIVFNHKAFTGRSGTFFGYEGLGSIYWHMVSKLQLAVQECCLNAIEQNESDEIIGGLLEHYYEINEGIGVHKSPALYGAFPTDPYSHTPAGKGAQQPGMTGQVKEDILSRYGELGVFVKEGKLLFNPCLLRKTEFLNAPQEIKYITLNGESKLQQLEAGTLCFTYCQVPIIYKLADENELVVFDVNEKASHFKSLELNKELSDLIFKRKGMIDRIIVKLKQDILK